MEADIWFTFKRGMHTQLFFFFPIWSFGQTQRLKRASTKTTGKITEMILNLTYAQLTPVKPNCVLMITLWTGSSKQTAICKAFRAQRMPSVRAIPQVGFALDMFKFEWNITAPLRVPWKHRERLLHS